MITVYAHGTWDLLHPGHIEHLKQAKAMGHRLVVGVTADEYVRKGPGRPVYSAVHRVGMLRALRFVDEVVLVDGPSAIPIIERLKPDVYVKGPDYAERIDGTFSEERKAVEAYGGRVAFTDGFTSSTSKLLNGSGAGLKIPGSPRYGIVQDWLNKAKAIRVFAIGEPIIDEYVWVEPAGKSPKENLITYISTVVEGRTYATYFGGVDIVASHLSQAATLSGRSHDWTQPIHKTRYVQRAFINKVFATAEIPPRQNKAPDWDSIVLADLVVMADYGHGIVHEPAEAAEYSRRIPWLALTVQSNSLNWGFNLVTKYPSAGYVVLDEQELRMACGSRNGNLQSLIREQAKRMETQVFAVTLGHHGCIVYDGHEFVEMPAMADKIVDRMGAGDAFLAWTAPLVKAGAPANVVALVGNVAGGLETGMIGNQVVTRSMVNRVLKAVLA